MIFEVLGKNKKYIDSTCSARASRPCFQKVLPLVTQLYHTARARGRRARAQTMQHGPSA
jgi:hypothetical protein